MYLGEVQVEQGDLDGFLAVAEELKVKGLSKEPECETKPAMEPRDEKTKNYNWTMPEMEAQPDTSKIADISVKNENFAFNNEVMPYPESNVMDRTFNYDGDIVERVDGYYTCPQCDKKIKGAPINYRMHMETH